MEALFSLFIANIWNTIDFFKDLFYYLFFILFWHVGS